MVSEKVTLYRANADKTDVIEQLPKTVTAQVYDFENGQFLDETLSELYTNIENIVVGEFTGLADDSVTLNKLSPQVRNLITNESSDITWANVLSKPTTFTPSTHTHDWAEVQSKPSTFTPTPHSHVWSDITNKPTTFTPTTHTHSYSDLTNKPSIPSLNNTALTGTPTAPTAAVGTNTTQIATTAFVKAVNDAHKTDVAPHQYGGKFEWRYNATTNSLDLVVL